MHPISHFKTQLNDLRATMKQRALLAHLHSQVQFLSQDIHAEEQRTGIFDPANVAYPMLARNLRARHDNLVATITMLESHLAETNMVA